MSKSIKAITAATLVAFLGACGSSTGDRALSGAGIGAVGGLAVGALTGMTLGVGTLIGAGVGAAVGGLTDSEDFDIGTPWWE